MTPRARRRAASFLLALLAVLLAWVGAHFHEIERSWQGVLHGTASKPGRAGAGPVFQGADADRQQLRIELEKIASGIPEPTDIQFPPGVEGYAVVLQKNGTARWLKPNTGVHGVFFTIDVETAVEQGLLGLAFHPDFARNGRFFINYVARAHDTNVSRVARYRVEPGAELSRATPVFERIVLEVAQPYANHKGGQLVFGPDKKLYIGWGDGGSQGDPHGNAQNPAAWLGKMLRIDVDAGEGESAYGVPDDNPFRTRPGYRPEIWALGLRNPWRYSFDLRGRLIVADVGASDWEELDIVEAGDNLGWNFKEGFVCNAREPAACRNPALVDPIHVYGRDEGSSIIGGFVYSGTRIPALRGLYVFGDFGSGRLFALALPARRERIEEVIALGAWPIVPSTFGRDAHGELYVASFVNGEIYRLGPATAEATGKVAK